MKKFLLTAVVLISLTSFSMAQSHRRPVHHRRVVHHHRHHVVHHAKPHHR